MSGDYSRKTFNPKKHFSGVLAQQGRVQLDADWNEEHDIQSYRIEVEAIDVIGQSGVPKNNGGFKIGTTAGDLTISPGRIYVDGLLFELDEPATYTTQPYFPKPEFTVPSSPPSSPPHAQLNLAPGFYLVYLDGSQREITVLDDSAIREVALDGPDTTTRVQNVWQVKLLQVSGLGSPPGSPPSLKLACKTQFAKFDEATAQSTGSLNAQTKPPKDEENVCLLPQGSGYTGPENQLYRVEIQNGGALNQATFKWSRENGSVETKITNIQNNVVTVSDTGKDEVLGFAGGQWVEIVDDESTLKGKPNPLAQIDKIDPLTGEITMKTSVAAFANLSGLKLRRWEQTGVNATANGLSANLASWIDLEGGIQVQFSPGLYHSGDYWLIPARTITGDIEWPRDDTPSKNPIPQPPVGIRHHYCRLAIIKVSGGVITIIEDCRKLFPPLTELIRFFYVGGGGEAMPGQRLPCTLQVGVVNDQSPVVGARVRFEIVSPSGGTLHSGATSGSSLDVVTNDKGVAECEWELDGLGASFGRGCLQVEARLMGTAGKLFEPPICFNANLSIASLVAYDPAGCSKFKPETRTVQAAIDELCRLVSRAEPGIKIKTVLTRADNLPVLNDRLMPVNRLAKGIVIACDRSISPVSVGGTPEPPPTNFNEAIAGKPTCFVTLDLPYPIGRDRDVWDFHNIVGYQPLILGSNVVAKENQIIWVPTTAANDWLQRILFRGLREIADRVLAHLTLKGNYIFTRDTSPPSTLYLDGEAFGRADADGRVALEFTGDGQRGGDFEMWFWLVEPESRQPSPTLTVTVINGPAGKIVAGSVQSAGAVVPGVQVTLTNLATGAAKTTVTDAQGQFAFQPVARGNYKVSVQVGDASAEQIVNVT